MKKIYLWALVPHKKKLINMGKMKQIDIQRANWIMANVVSVDHVWENYVPERVKGKWRSSPTKDPHNATDYVSTEGWWCKVCPAWIDDGDIEGHVAISHSKVLEYET